MIPIEVEVNGGTNLGPFDGTAQEPSILKDVPHDILIVPRVAFATVMVMM
jgi:hypothetical protein